MFYMKFCHFIHNSLKEINKNHLCLVLKLKQGEIKPCLEIKTVFIDFHQLPRHPISSH